MIKLLSGKIAVDYFGLDHFIKIKRRVNVTIPFGALRDFPVFV